MKTKLLPTMTAVLMAVCGFATAQQPPAGEASVAESQVTSDPVPPEVTASAVAAVSKLGDEVVLGRYAYAVDRMYPQWKERTANRMGGMDALKKQLAGVAEQMGQQGISMISSKPQGQPRVYQVSPGMVKTKENPTEAVKLVYGKWLVFVPTITRFRIMQSIAKGTPPRIITIDSTSFQAAISDKGKLDWTFIDGAGLTTADLRSLFVTLPQDLELPPVKKHEASK